MRAPPDRHWRSYGNEPLPTPAEAMAIDGHDDLDTARGLLAAIVLSLAIWMLLRRL